MRAQHIHTARVYLREARTRRGQSFSWTLLEWAGNARRRAAACIARPAQLELFGVAP